jgi:polyisoprenoid-binding protein YceI
MPEITTEESALMFRRIAAASAAAVSLMLMSVPLHGATYTLEPNYTQGVLRWNHLGFSSPSAQFSQGEGRLEFDPAAPAKASVSVTIPLSSLHTGVPALDEDFFSSDFFDVATYPTATFKSTRVERGRAHGHLTVTGDLSLHGTTKPVTLDVTVVKIGTNPRSHLPTVGFDATTVLRRSDFGLGKYVPQVGDEIDLHITSQAVEATAYAQYLEATAKAAAAEAAAAQGSAQQ